MGGSPVQRGFSLIEVLVSFVLLSLTLGTILQIFSGGLRNIGAAERYAQAMVLADGKIALLGSEIPLETGDRSGEEGDYRWQLSIQPYRDPASETGGPVSGRRLYEIDLSVRWSLGTRSPELHLKTLRVETSL